jgi:tRNA(Ile)-lysidine synthase
MTDAVEPALPDDLPDGAHLVVALSGGVDSIALLDLLCRTSRFRITAWHLDHRLRADSSLDAAWVAAHCAAVGVACVCESAEVLAEVRGDGIEEAARRVRYARLAEACVRLGAVAACTAHHRDDQAETALLQILRGCGPEGPTGIATERPLAPGLRLIRPLLHATRADLVAHCLSRGLSWREDESNADVRFRRNHLRHRILPEWERHCPGIAAALAQLAHGGFQRRQQAERQVVGLLDGVDLDAPELLRLPPEVRAACWRLLLNRLGIPADRGRLRRLDDLLNGGPGRRLRLGSWLFLRRARRVTWTAVR